ncbi:tetratricopeptide repeat protein [Ectopseudomonas mendocina]|uniref:tetratricopeptide repeat protein n=1 Tax=Ectopseudomonas mendocina TaxID=300 RepID=UPI003EFC3EB3
MEAFIILVMVVLIAFRLAESFSKEDEEVHLDFSGHSASITPSDAAQINRISVLSLSAPELALQVASRLWGDAWQIAHASLCTVLLKLGREDEALKLLSSLEAPYAQKALEEMLQHMVDDGQVDKAIEMKARLPAQRPSLPLLDAELLLAEGKADEARNVLAALDQSDQLDASQLIDLARMQQRCEMPDAAQLSLAKAEEALNTEEQSSIIEWRPFMQALAEFQRYAELLQLAERSEEDKRFIAQLLLDHGQYEHSLTLLDSLDSSAAYLLDYEKLLNQLLHDKRHDLAQELLANATGSTHSILLEHYLDWYVRQGDTQQAQRLLDKETPRLEPATLNWLLLHLAQRHFERQPYWAGNLQRQSDRLVSSRKGQPEWPFMRLLHLQHLLKEQAGRSLSQRDSWTIRNHLEEIAKLHAQLEFDDALTERIHHCELLHALGEAEQTRTLMQEIERQLRDTQFPEEDDRGFYCDEFVTALIKLGELGTARKLLEEGLASDWQEESLLQAYVEADRLEEAVELISFKTLIGHTDAPINALHQRILSLAELDKPRSQRLQQRLLERLDDDKTWKAWGIVSQGQRNETECAI